MTTENFSSKTVLKDTPCTGIFRTAAGFCTGYALACGYQDVHKNGEKTLNLWHEGGPAYHVRAHDHASGKRLTWESFERLADARRYFKQWREKLKNDDCFEAYLQHGSHSNGPFLTEKIDVMRQPMPHHIRGLSYTASAYGERIPTEYMVRWEGRWRRVYCRIFSNSGTLYIRVAASVSANKRLIVQLDRI